MRAGVGAAKFPRRAWAVAAITMVLPAACTATTVSRQGSLSAVAPFSGASRPVSGPPDAPPAAQPPAAQPPARGPFAVGLRQVTFIDRSRTVPGSHTTTGRPGPRVLVTDVWYPAEGAPGGISNPGAAPAGGRFPLVVFAPGFDRGPSSYAPLLAAWARAGYVVAAPSFPLTSPGAVGGLDEFDIVNQPGDLRFLIGRLSRASASARGAFAGLIDPGRIAVAGHSDGADAALAAADGSCCRDPRIGAVIVMAGAALPFGGRYFMQPGPPLLVMQGSADAFNPPAYARDLYARAPPPKYLLWMPGADHSTPFTGTGPFAQAVRSVSTAFLGRYLGDPPVTPIGLPLAVRGTATLSRAPR